MILLGGAALVFGAALAMGEPWLLTWRQMADRWSAAVSVFRAFPWLGVGAGNFELLAAQHNVFLSVPKFVHSAPLLFLAESGIFGGLLWLVLSVLLLRWLAAARPPYAASLFLLFLFSLANPFFEISSLGFLFFFLLGLSLPPGTDCGIRRPLLRSMAVVGLLITAVLGAGRIYHDRAAELLKPGHRPADLEQARRDLEISRTLWPAAATDATLGRVWMEMAAADPGARIRYLVLAQSEFATAVRKSPETHLYRAGLGETFLAMGEKRKAAAQFREAARLHPSGTYVSKYVQLLSELSDV